MALKIANRVVETTTTTGTGTLSLGGATSGFVTFANGVGDGNTCAYLIDDGNGNWELSWGVVAAGTPDTLTRAALIGSSTGSAVSFGAGTKTVALVAMIADTMAWVGESGALASTSIASASTCDIGALKTFRANITGTTTITSFGSAKNTLRYITFAGVLTLTHNATSLILPGAANITTAAGDRAIAISDGSGYWLVLAYTKANGGVVAPTQVATDIGSTAAMVVLQNAGKPRFSAFKTSTSADVTGDGTTVTIVGNSEIFDVGSNYDNSTGIFTAPVSGVYRLSCNLRLSSSVSSTTALLQLVTSNRTYSLFEQLQPSSNAVLGIGGTVLADMDAGDTAYFTITCSGGTKVVDLFGNATVLYTALQGELVG